MCRWRHVRNIYLRCGHAENLPPVEVKCDNRHCKFSPDHPSGCVPPKCARTCNQYHLFPEQYHPNVDGFCPACIRSPVGLRPRSHVVSARDDHSDIEQRDSTPLTIAGLHVVSARDDHSDTDHGSDTDDHSPPRMAGFQTPTTSSSSGSESDVAEILPRATPGTRQNSSLLSTISHFPIIYTPSSTTTGSLSQTDAVALRCEDTHTLQNELTSGGVLVSVKSPHDAMSWIEAHQDHPLLQSLKSHNVAGPIAVRISPEESALAIFGSIADALVPEMARNLVAVSGFSVMVRSSVDNPIPAFVQHVSEGNDLSCEQPYSVSFGPVARLRGGADPAEDDCETWTTPKWEGKYHNATVDLKLRLGNEKVYDVTLDSYMKFKTQPLVNSNPTMFRPQPEVLSHVNLKVQLRRGETMLDRSFSNLGFVVHRPRAISTCDFLDLGFGPPETRIKRCNQDSSTKTGGGSFGLEGLVPVLNINAACTRGVTQTMEIADEKPIPKCATRHDLGKSWDREEAEKAGKDFRSYDISWLPARDGENIAYEMYVEFGLGMYLHKKKQRELPHISSVLRNQVMIWVSDPDLSAKGMGILLMTSTYIPDALTKETLEIHETTTVDLKQPGVHATSSSGHNEEPYNAAMSVSVAALKKPKKQRTPGMLGKLLDRMTPKRDALVPPTAPASLFMNETVSRGWDATNMRWKSVVWPMLDRDFCCVHKSDRVAWQLRWGEPTVPAPAAPRLIPPKAAASEPVENDVIME